MRGDRRGDASDLGIQPGEVLGDGRPLPEELLVACVHGRLVRRGWRRRAKQKSADPGGTALWKSGGARVAYSAVTTFTLR